MKRKTIFAILIITSILFVNKVNATERISQEEFNKSSYSAMQEESKQNAIMLLADYGTTIVETWDISATSSDHVTATLYSDGLLKISGTGKMKEWSSCLKIPWYNEKKQIINVIIEEGVTSIGFCAFYDCSNLTSINIPEGVTSIGNRAFYRCSSLTSINVNKDNLKYSSENGILLNKSKTEIIQYPAGKQDTEYSIPKGITSIGESAFSCCSNLTSINISEGVTNIGEYAFDSCSNLTNIKIPEGVKSIGEFAFWGCSNLTSIKIPEGVKSIGEFAFWGCSNLTSINIPEGVTSIGYCTFYDCSNLTSINVEKNNNQYCSEDGILLNKNKTEIIQYPAGKQDTEYSIPEGVTNIGSYAFYRCSNLTSIKIPEGVINIGSYAFDHCSNLTSINIPKGVTSIGYCTFYDCSNLTSIKIPESVTSIGDNAFLSCSNLTSINIPEGVTSIGNNVFFNCSRLTSINAYCNTYAEEYVKRNYKDKLNTIHTYQEQVTLPTCTEKGYTTHTCTRCNDRYIDSEVEAKGHTEVIDSKVEPTCTIPGKTEGKHCSVCHKVIVAQKETPALGHQFGEWKIVKGSTCTEDGRKERKCNACNEKETEVIAKLGHSYETKIIAPTKTEQGYTEHTCSRCKNSYKDNYVPALGEEELVMHINEVENQYEQKVVENIRYVLVQSETTKENLRKQIVTNGEYEILNKDKQVKEKDILATSDVIKFKEKEDVEYIIIVKGDVDGNGIIDFLGDIVLLNNYRLGRIKEISVESKLAGDINENGEIDFMNDIVKMNNYRIGILHQLNK